VFKAKVSPHSACDSDRAEPGAPHRVDQQVDGPEALEGGVDQHHRRFLVLRRPGDGHHGQPLGLQGRFGGPQTVQGAGVDHH
jgi:hypothetical protein